MTFAKSVTFYVCVCVFSPLRVLSCWEGHKMNVSFKNPICLANLYYRGGISQLYLQCKVESTHCFNLIASSELVRGFWLPCCHLKLIYAFKKKFRRKKVTILCMSVDFASQHSNTWLSLEQTDCLVVVQLGSSSLPLDKVARCPFFA